MSEDFKALYNAVAKYQITAICKEPLHIGSSMGDKGEVLIDTITNKPFIQGSSLAGIIGSYYEKLNEENDRIQLFGGVKKEGQKEFASKIKFSNGEFSKIKMELRPRLRIDGVTGTASSKKGKGTGKESGQKFEMEYIGADSEFSFNVYIFQEDILNLKNIEKKFEEILGDLHNGNLQLGGQTSFGCGHVELEKVLLKEFDLYEEEDLNSWKKEDELTEKELIDITNKIKQQKVREDCYEIELKGKIDNDLLIKGICNVNYVQGKMCSESITNSQKKYIIPATSLKGIIRNQTEKILKFKNINNEEYVNWMFGKESKNKKERGIIGNLIFSDTIIERKKNVTVPRIKIDKFTGGVIRGSLLTEKTVSGDINIKIKIKKQAKNSDKKANISCALLMYVLRDMSLGYINLGGGASIGRGFIKNATLKVNGIDSEVEVNMESMKIEKGKEFIDECVNELEKSCV